MKGEEINKQVRKLNQVGSHPTPHISNGLLDEHPSIQISLAFSKQFSIPNGNYVDVSIFHHQGKATPRTPLTKEFKA